MSFEAVTTAVGYTHSGLSLHSLPSSLSFWFDMPTDGAAENLVQVIDQSSTPQTYKIQMRGGNSLRCTLTGSAAETNNTYTYGSGFSHAMCAISATDVNVALDGDWANRGTISSGSFAENNLDQINAAYGGNDTIRIAELAVWTAELTEAENAILAAGFSPLFVRPQSLYFYAPYIDGGVASPVEYIQGGGTITNSPTAFDHPAIRYPAPKHYWSIPSTGAGAALTGTATASITEFDIVTGGKTIIITLTGDTFKAAGTGPIGSTADTQALIDGFDAASSPTNGWNNEVRDKAATTEIVRDSDTQATWTIAAQAGYDISGQETITGTIPTDVLVTAGPFTATPTFTVDLVAGAFLIAGSLALLGVGI